MTEFDLGGGNRLVLDDLTPLEHHPTVTAAIEAKAQAAAAYANSIAITEDAHYYVRTRDGVVGVMPDTFEAVVDDAYHSTILKVLSHEGTHD